MFARSRVRIALGYVGILALILVLFGVVVVLGFWGAVNDLQDKQLERQAKDRRSVVSSSVAYSGGSDEFGWSAVGPDGRPLARVSTGSALGLPYPGLARQAAREREIVPATVRGPEGAVRLVSLPVERSGTVVAVVQVAQPREVVQEAVVRFVRVLVPTELLALVLATFGGLFVSGRAMRPITEAFEKQRTFVADASHELKTPLTLIKIDAEMMARTPKTPDDREFLGHLLAETDRMDAILSELLVLARLDTGKLAVVREPFNLADVVMETADRFGRRAAAEGVRLAVEVSGKLPTRGDRERSGQVLAALLDNALRHTPQGGMVAIACRHRDGGAEAEVKDSGPGIPPEHLRHVFDRFYRAEAARTRGEDGKGTGLGLTIARELARAQDGELTAENAQGGGALFRLTLPAARDPVG
jgi:signal transduction histidine kinase